MNKLMVVVAAGLLSGTVYASDQFTLGDGVADNFVASVNPEMSVYSGKSFQLGEGVIDSRVGWYEASSSTSQPEVGDSEPFDLLDYLESTM
jgi:hypothetical protein